MYFERVKEDYKEKVRKQKADTPDEGPRGKVPRSIRDPD